MEKANKKKIFGKIEAGIRQAAEELTVQRFL